jgi:DNA-binding response OmpR family regulator
MANEKVILALIPDLMFGTRVKETLSNAGYTVLLADTQEESKSALLDASPELIILDLDAFASQVVDVVGQAKEAGVPVLGFGRHTESQALATAKAAGCAAAVARSRLVTDMTGLASKYAKPRAEM